MKLNHYDTRTKRITIKGPQCEVQFFKRNEIEKNTKDLKKYLKDEIIKIKHLLIMFKNKKYIADRQAFIEWKRTHTTQKGKFYAECFDENEPKSYPCILFEIEGYINGRDEYSLFYGFVYLTDFISDYGK